MKIIDERGRIFGKINLIDFLVILFLLSLMPMLYFGNRIVNNKNPIVEEKTRIVQVKFSNVIPEISRVLKVGDIDTDRERGKLKAILNNRTTSADSPNRDILTLIEISCEEKAGILFYKKGPVKIGSHFSFTTNFYDISGVVIDLGTGDISPKGRNLAEVEVKFSDVIPELVRIIRIGDIDADLKNTAPAKLKAILSDKATEYLELKTLIQDKQVVAINSLNRDIVVLFDIVCEEQAGTLFYKEMAVKVGSPFSFTTGLYTISGVVVGIKNRLND